MLRTDTKTIEGLEVTVTQFPALRSLRLMARLGGIITPMLGAFELFEGMTMQSEIELARLQPLLMQLFATLTPDTAASLACEMLSGASVLYENKRVELNDAGRIDLIFGGNLKGMLKSIWFAAEVNYKDFFGGTPADAVAPS